MVLYMTQPEVERNYVYITQQQGRIITGRTHGKLYREIADEMDVTVGTIRKQLHRLRRQAERCEKTLDLFDADEWDDMDTEDTWLTAKEARTLYLFRNEGLSYEDIARKLNVSPSTVGTRLQRARDKRDKCYRTLGSLEDAVIDIHEEPHEADAGSRGGR